MSAIAGIYRLNGKPVEKRVMESMTDRMSHRGPDSQTVWSDGSVGLGHCMLHTTPESLYASLPHRSEQSGCVITADARIDNRSELIQALQLNSVPDEEIPDSMLIVRAYEKWGTACVEHLLGAFAFALWDERENQLFCARDHFGVKPFYYYHERGELFAFASEIKALFQLESVPQEPNEIKVAEHLMAPVEGDATRTYFRDICSLAPAHLLVVTPDGATDREYWSLDPNREIHLSSDEEYAERFRALFEEAVHVRLRSTSPLGAMLSGGLDSSSITCQAAQILRASDDDRSLHTFSAVFDDVTESDERPYIDAVLNEYDELQPHFIRGDEKSPLAEWDELYEYVDGACTAGNIYIVWRAHHLAQEHGIRVMLDGFDGDTTVSHGVGYFNQLREEKRWLTLVREVKEFAKKNNESPRGAVWSWIRRPLLSVPGMPQLASVWRALKGWGTGENGQMQQAPEEPAWRRALHDELLQKIEPYLETDQNVKPPTERENHYQLLTRPLMTHILDLWSYVSAGSSIDVRYPFYDKRLVEFCLALPPEQKIRRGWSRLIMRRAMEGILPPSIQWREGKGDLSHGFDRSLVTYERDLLERLMQGGIGEIDCFVTPDFLQEEVHNYLNGQADTGSQGEGLIVWRALALALWLQHMEDRIWMEEDRPKDDINV